MYCNQCGSQQNVAGARFCNACGSALPVSSTAPQMSPVTSVESIVTPPAGKKSNLVLYIVIGGIIFFAVFVSFALSRTKQVIADRAALVSTATAVEMKDTAKTPKSENWYYSNRTDDMSGKPMKSATVTSTNTVNFDFPYRGEQHAQLTLRKHPRYGSDVILSIEKGQFLAGVSGVQVLVRFDEGAAMKFWAQGSADNSTTSLFLGGYAKFVAAARKAKIARISTPIYQEGSPVFEFNVEGFEER